MNEVTGTLKMTDVERWESKFLDFCDFGELHAEGDTSSRTVRNTGWWSVEGWGSLMMSCKYKGGTQWDAYDLMVCRVLP
eukprot:SAG11_NODE_213_length_12262_cov_8.391597_9_plen_79_part_00